MYKRQVPGWRWLYFRAPANQRSAGGVGVSTPCGAFSTRGITVFVPSLSELSMYGGIAEPGMGIYPPRVRQDRGVSPRGNSRRARLAPLLAESGRRGSPRAMKLGLGKRWDKSHFAYHIRLCQQLHQVQTNINHSTKYKRASKISWVNE